MIAWRLAFVLTMFLVPHGQGLAQETRGVLRAGGSSFVWARYATQSASSLYAVRDLGPVSVVAAMPESPDRLSRGVGWCALHLTRLAEEGGYWWWHTEDDTFDKVDMSILETDAEIYGDALTTLLTGALPLDVAAQTGALVAALERRNGQAQGRFDLSEAVNLAQRLRDMVASYYDGGANPAAPNLRTEQSLIRFLRPLHRVMYSPLDPYHPDPGTNLGTLPGLAPVAILSEESPQSDRYHFAIATLIRERNRVLDAIDQSIQVLVTISSPTGRE